MVCIKISNLFNKTTAQAATTSLKQQPAGGYINGWAAVASGGGGALAPPLGVQSEAGPTPHAASQGGPWDAEAVQRGVTHGSPPVGRSRPAGRASDGGGAALARLPHARRPRLRRG
jgi:hypothetical protein